ncbi:MAG: YitT family protein [Syntrophomonas sp.]|nr:YitT family protein [Syntrophomonas sp.]
MYFSEPVNKVTANLKRFKEKISFQDILGIILGSFILALSIQLILVPAHILTGGVTGIAIILKFLLRIDIWIWYISLNIPIFILGYKFISKRFALYSLIGMLALTLFLRVTQNWMLNLGIDDLLLSVLLGGVISGLGTGICLRCKGSTGGTDIIAVIISNLWGYNIGSIFFAINLIILGVFLFTSNIELTLFSAISIFVSGKVVDKVQSGSNVSRTALIVSEQSNDIAAAIMANLNRGCTYLAGKGAYTGETRDIIMVTIARTQLPRLKEIVFQLDPNAFITINDTIEVLGKGFKKSGPEF